MRGKILARFLIVEKGKNKMNQVRQWTTKMNDLYRRPENRANVNICVLGLRDLENVSK